MAFVLATDNPHLSCVSGEKRDSTPSIYAFRTLSTEANVIAAGFFNTLYRYPQNRGYPHDRHGHRHSRRTNWRG